MVLPSTYYLILITTFLTACLTYIKWAYTYWKRKNIPYIEPTIPIGTLGKSAIQIIALGDQNKNHYDKAKSLGYKHVGLFSFWIPIYMPICPQILKNILSKDFNHFRDRGIYYNEKDEPIGAHLFSLEGTKWKNLRTKLTPTFTTGKIKMMFPIITECGTNLKNALNEPSLDDQPVEIKTFLGNFTADVIGSCAFGLDCNSFANPNSEFRLYGKKAFTESKFQFLKTLFGNCFPTFAKMLGLTVLRRDVIEFYTNVVKDTLKYRESNNVQRNDFLQLIVDLKTQNDDGLTFDEIAAQCYLFFIAGYETSSTTMTFCLYELSKDASIQKKVREELVAVFDKNGGELTYEGVMEMKYLGQVVDETLRKYPPLPTLYRVCVADYKLPGSEDFIEKGTHVAISTMGIHRDSDYYPNPEKFDPERFSDENRSKIRPFTYIPFGDGPRICIASRFGLLQTKVGLAVLLKNFSFSLSEKTKTPLRFDPTTIILSTAEKIWLDVEKLNN